MGRHSKKFHNLRAMNENRRAKALALANGLPPPPPLALSSSERDRDEEREADEAAAAKVKPKRVPVANSATREQRSYERPVRTHQPYNPYDDGADGEENETRRRSNQRREIRRTDNNGIPLALVNLLETSRKIKRNPGRFIPNLPGFSALSKLESKKDLQSIGKDNLYEAPSDMDSDDEVEPPPGVLYNPACLPESSVHKKRARLTTWASNPHEMNNNLKRARGDVNRLKHELDELDRSNEQWINNFAASRMKINYLTNSVYEDVARHRIDAKALYRLFANDPKNAVENTTAFGTRSSTNNVFNSGTDDGVSYPLTNLQIQELIKSYRSSQSLLETKIDQYEKLVKECSNGNGRSPRNKVSIPLVQMSIEELDYSYDRDGSQNAQQAQNIRSIEELLTETENSLKCGLKFRHDLDESSSFTNKYDFEKLDEAQWQELLNQQVVIDSEGSLSAATKNCAQTESLIPVMAFPESFTPRDVSLLVSPLSQFEDRYVGVLYGTEDRQGGSESATLSQKLVAEENAAILRCSIQSKAAAADTIVRRLRSSLTDWRKIAADSRISTEKHLSVHAIIYQEQVSEMMRLRHELESYGIVKSIVEDKRISSPSSHDVAVCVTNGGQKEFHNGKASKNSPSVKSAAKAKMTKVPAKNSRVSPLPGDSTIAVN